MRLKHFELRTPNGAYLSATVVSQEGIWHLYNLITVGDTIRTRTQRKVVKEGAAGGAGAAATRRVTLALNLLVTQPPEYDAKGILRISGKNQSECDDVPLQAHHTFEIAYDPPQDFKLFTQEWTNLQSMRLREACSDESKSDVAAILMQNGSAQVCFLNGTVCTTRAKVEVAVPKKRKGSSAGRDDTILKFFGQLLDAVLANIPIEKMKVVLLCSPGHVREEWLTYVVHEASRADAPVALKTFVGEKSKFCSVKVSSGHRAALMEALEDPVVQQRMQSARVASDVRLFNDFQALMAKDAERCVYGVEGVLQAAQSQAVDTLLLLDELLRSPEPVARHLYTELAAEVAEYGGTVQIVSSIGVTGDQLRALTGVAAMLRLPMPELDDIEPDEDFLRSETVSLFLQQRRSDRASSAEPMRSHTSGGDSSTA